MSELNASFDTRELEKKLSVLSSGLGNIYNELLKEVGEEMSAEAQSKAAGAFNNRTGRLQRSIKFILNKEIGALTTQNSLNKSNVWYARMVEFGANIEAKNKEYLTFKINGEWKKVKKVTRRPRPFMYPVFSDYFGGDSSKGLRKLQEALLRRVEQDLN